MYYYLMYKCILDTEIPGGTCPTFPPHPNGRHCLSPKPFPCRGQPRTVLLKTKIVDCRLLVQCLNLDLKKMYCYRHELRGKIVDHFETLINKCYFWVIRRKKNMWPLGWWNLVRTTGVTTRNEHHLRGLAVDVYA